MKHWEKFDIRTIPQWKIVFVMTTPPGYSMERVMLAESHPTFGDYLLVQGSHCSCFGFDDTEWDATVYDYEEIKKLMQSWAESWMDFEREVAPLILATLGDQ